MALPNVHPPLSLPKRGYVLIFAETTYNTTVVACTVDMVFNICLSFRGIKVHTIYGCIQCSTPVIVTVCYLLPLGYEARYEYPLYGS